jgi:hypothetical protein
MAARVTARGAEARRQGVLTVTGAARTLLFSFVSGTTASPSARARNVMDAGRGRVRDRERRGSRARSAGGELGKGAEAQRHVRRVKDGVRGQVEARRSGGRLSRTLVTAGVGHADRGAGDCGCRCGQCTHYEVRFDGDGSRSHVVGFVRLRDGALAVGPGQDVVDAGGSSGGEDEGGGSELEAAAASSGTERVPRRTSAASKRRLVEK